MTINAIKKKDYRNENYIFIKILRIVNRKRSEFKTGIKIHKDLWDNKKRVVKKTQQVDYNNINKIIREKIEKVRELTETSDVSNENNKSSFIWYLNQELDRLERINSPSLPKYKTTKKHLLKYQDYLNLSDIKFSQIDYNWIKGFEDMMDENGLSQNTRTGYLKKVQKLFRDSIRDKTFLTTIDPFNQYKFKIEKTQVEYLSKEHITNLTNHTYPKGSRLQNTKHRFLFQYYGNGMRSSDMFFMRFNNIKFNGYNTRLKFVQFKTKDPHSLRIGRNLMKQIFYFIDIDKYYEIYHERKFMMDINGTFQERTLNEIIVQFFAVNLTETPEIEQEEIKSTINDLLDKIYIEQLNHIKKMSKTKMNHFIIPIISNKLFEKSTFNSNHKHDKKQKSHHSGRLTLYNRYLKDLDDVISSRINLVSHTARHTFANVQLNNGVGIYTISKSLGHQNIGTTESYINNFNSDLIDRQLRNSDEELTFDIWRDLY